MAPIQETSRAVVAFDPDHANAGHFLTALKAKFPGAVSDTGFPGSIIVHLDPTAPDSDALMILEESIGQGCPAEIGYPRLFR